MLSAPGYGWRDARCVWILQGHAVFRSLRKRKSQLDSNNSLAPTSSKQNNAVELLPVVLQAKTDRLLKTYSPIFIDNCLKKCIGPYKACSPLSNDNLIVTCSCAQQVKTLLSCTTLSDGTKTVEVVASSLKPVGAKGAIYNVPLEISTEEILQGLTGQIVSFAKRFRVKCKDSSEFRDST